jgi:hypothetical protein
MNTNQRYILFLDILGFSEMVSVKSADEIMTIIKDSILQFEIWKKRNSDFDLIYFSDSFVFYQKTTGYASWAFLDIYAISAMILSALLAHEIPARGVINFGEFYVEENIEKNRNQIFYGKALVEAYKAERNENWIGITILQNAWEPFNYENDNLINTFESEGVWRKRDDGVLLLNPLLKLRSWYDSSLVGEITKPYMEWDAPEFPNDILALKFIIKTSEKYILNGDFNSKMATKYHSTLQFFKNVMPDYIYKWGLELVESIES